MWDPNVNADMKLQEGNHLSLTRAQFAANSYCILPKAFCVPGPLPEWANTKVYYLATPSMGAKFLECRLKIFTGGGSKETMVSPYENYMYVIGGEIELTISGKKYRLEPEGFFWVPPLVDFSVINKNCEEANVLWIRKKYIETKFYSIPAPVVSSILELPVKRTSAEKIQMCLPEDNLGYDMACNIMAFDPGVTFPCTEIHVFEHGEYVLNGRGNIWLNGTYHEMMEEDFIYINAFTPHYVNAYGPGELRYLLYKDLSRDYSLD
jgi:(S)-ureidoglycine aminohydrolase